MRSALWISLSWDLPCQGCLPSAMTNNGAAKFLNQDHESTNHEPARIEELCQHDEAKRSVACWTLKINHLDWLREPSWFCIRGTVAGVHGATRDSTSSNLVRMHRRPCLWLGRFQIQICSLKPAAFQSRMSCHHWRFLNGATLMPDSCGVGLPDLEPSTSPPTRPLPEPVPSIPSAR